MKPTPVLAAIALLILAACGHAAQAPAPTARSSPAIATSAYTNASVEKLIRDELELDMACGHISIDEVEITKSPSNPDLFRFKSVYYEHCEGGDPVSYIAKGTANMKTRRVTLTDLEPEFDDLAGRVVRKESLGSRPSQLHRVRSARPSAGIRP